MNVLITGAGGFVGQALARALLDAGAFVVSAVRDREYARTPPGTVVCYGDVTDAAFCRRVVSDHRIDVVYHLAAQSIVSACAQDPRGALRTAVLGTYEMLAACLDTTRPRVVVMTSDKVYGSAPPPYHESTALDARNPYEVSKAAQDLVARMFAGKGFELDVSVVRAVNIYGPRDPNDTRLIPQTMRRCLRGEAPLLHSGAAQMERQYIYIDDMVEALRFIAANGIAGGAYCVGSPSAPVSTLQVLALIADIAGVVWKQPEERARDDRFAEIQVQAIDDTKLRQMGWTPHVQLRDGLQRTLNWYRSTAA